MWEGLETSGVAGEPLTGFCLRLPARSRMFERSLILECARRTS